MHEITQPYLVKVVSNRHPSEKYESVGMIRHKPIFFGKIEKWQPVTTNQKHQFHTKNDSNEQ